MAERDYEAAWIIYVVHPQAISAETLLMWVPRPTKGKDKRGRTRGKDTRGRTRREGHRGRGHERKRT